MAAFFKRMFKQYTVAMEKHPYTVNMISSGVLWFCGDYISQRIEHSNSKKSIEHKASKEPTSVIADNSSNDSKNNITPVTSAQDEKFTLDTTRILKMTTFGLFLAGPIYCWWYAILDRKTIHLASSSFYKYIGYKVLADQLIFEPPYLTFFFVTTCAFEKKSIKETFTKIKEEWVSTYVMDWKVWPLAQAINFRYVPVLYQPVVVNLICVGWNAYLSFVQHR